MGAEISGSTDAGSGARRGDEFASTGLSKKVAETAASWPARKLAPSTSRHLGNWSHCEPNRYLDPWKQARSGFEVVFTLHGALVPHVWKNGGTTLRNFVLRHGGRIVLTNRLYRLFSRMEEPSIANFSGEYVAGEPQQVFAQSVEFKAALVRDPLDRILSAFHEVFSRSAKKLTARSPSLFEDQATLAAWLQATLDGKPIIPEVGLANDHFLPQTKFLLDEQGKKFNLDYIGSTKNMDDEVDYIFRQPWAKLPHLSGPSDFKGPAFRINAAQLPTSVVRKVCELYKVDYCCFGFQPPRGCSDFSC